MTEKGSCGGRGLEVKTLLAEIDRLRDDAAAIAVEADHFREEAKKFKAQRDRALTALRHARPVIFNALCAAKADEQPWQVETRKKILDRVDRELDEEAA